MLEGKNGVILRKLMVGGKTSIDKCHNFEIFRRQNVYAKIGINKLRCKS